MIPERCERFRKSFSLQLDEMVSRFDSVLLERHLRGCASCRAFADALDAQTKLLRDAPLEEPDRSAAGALPRTTRPARRRSVVMVAGALAVAAATLAITPNAGHRSHVTSATAQKTAKQETTGKLLLAVFPERPSAGATFEVPRLRVVSPASADGAVRGYYGVPVPI